MIEQQTANTSQPEVAGSTQAKQSDDASTECSLTDNSEAVSSEEIQSPVPQAINGTSLAKKLETKKSVINSPLKNENSPETAISEETHKTPAHKLSEVSEIPTEDNVEEKPSIDIAKTTDVVILTPNKEFSRETKDPNLTPKSQVGISAIDKSKSIIDSVDSVKNLVSPENVADSEISQPETQSDQQYAEHVTYTEDGTAIYVHPKTQHKYKWCPTKNEWIAIDGGGSGDGSENTNPNENGNSKNSNPFENEHYRWCKETHQWLLKTNEQTETEHYRWDAIKKEWIMKNQVPSLKDVTYGYDNGMRIYTDIDGMVFFWDEDKKAWFPKIDDDFLAQYQMSYGFIDNTTAPTPTPASSSASVLESAITQEEVSKIDSEKSPEDIKKNETRESGGGGVKRKAEPPKWFEVDQTQNTKVYVSNLPLDITMEEFSEIMSKCGMIMKDPQTQKQKLKLYAEPDGQLKGDGLCDYIKIESVDLALKLLDESFVRGNKIKVQRAKFQMRGQYNPLLKPKKKKKDKEKLIKMKEKLFDWRPEKMRGERSKFERTVIIKNLFTPELFDKEVQLIIEYQNDLREECSKCGTVRKVVVYDRHPEGIAQVNMADPEQADLVIQMMNGRFFGKRKLTAESWDGKTKYKVAETEEEIQARINKWDKYLEKGEAMDYDENDKNDNQTGDEVTKNKSDGRELVSETKI